jgi:hypothetical protein
MVAEVLLMLVAVTDEIIGAVGDGIAVVNVKLPDMANTQAEFEDQAA